MGILQSEFSPLIWMGVSLKSVFRFKLFFFFFITGIAENVSNREENNKENKNTTLIALGCIRKIEELFFFFFLDC